MEEHTYLIGLTRIPSLGPKRCRHLVEIFGSAEAVFKASKRDLLRMSFIKKEQVNVLQDGKVLREAEQLIVDAQKSDQDIITYLDEAYPSRLHHTPHAPLILYKKGQPELNATRMVGIVGTRTPSEYGIRQTEELVSSLKGVGVTIVSGLAYGIDIVSHQTALRFGLPTVAVLGGALNRIYPSNHKRTLAEMCENGGGAISEFPPGVKAEREHFPMRNRILAGCCDVIAVMESGVKGGSMITAKMAYDYDRDVVALPGRVDQLKANGCHLLIKEHQAHLIEGAADLLALMQWNEDLHERPSKISLPSEPFARKVVEAVRQCGRMHVDLLTTQLDLTPGQWSSLSLQLEMEGFIQIRPGSMITAD